MSIIVKFAKSATMVIDGGISTCGNASHNIKIGRISNYLKEPYKMEKTTLVWPQCRACGLNLRYEPNPSGTMGYYVCNAHPEALYPIEDVINRLNASTPDNFDWQLVDIAQKTIKDLWTRIQAAESAATERGWGT